MPADPHETQQPHIGLDHQLPAPPRRSNAVRVLVWVVILLIFAIAIYLVMNKQDAPKAPGGRGAGGGGPVTITTATAQQGDIGVYLDAIGTVTPVYTSSITSQVNGLITAVHYKEGQLVRKGQSLIDIDDRSYRATLLQAQGTLEKDQNVLAQARMDPRSLQAAWARNAIAKQILDDQDKLVLQGRGNREERRGSRRLRPGAGELLPHHLAHHRTRWSAARRSRQRRAGERNNHACGHHADSANHRRLHHP